MTPIRTKSPLLPKLMRIFGIVSLLVIGVWYVTFQARYMIAGPKVSLLEEPAVVHSERLVTLHGQANNITALYLNGQPIMTDPDGVFKVAVVLPNGYTTVSIDARDRYGRTIHLERPLVYSPASSPSGDALSLGNHLESQRNMIR